MRTAEMKTRYVAISLAAAFLVLAPSAGATRLAGEGPVSLKASAASWIVLGSKVGISGKLTPHPAGTQVSLQLGTAGAWHTIGTSSVRGNGSFVFTMTPTSPGLATYRVVTGAGKTLAKSANVPVDVYHWTYLGDSYEHPAAGDLITDPVESNGVTWQHPVALDAGCYNAWNGSAWVDYHLGRQYETFTATVGLDEEAPDGTTATYTVVGDAKKLASGSLVPGAKTKIDVSLEGIARMRITINFPDPTGAAGCGIYFPKVVFGDAQLLGP
jgi:hypothetical protein